MSEEKRGRSRRRQPVANAASVSTSAPAPSRSESEAMQAAGKRLYGRRPRLEVSTSVEDGVLHIGAPHSDEGGFAVRVRDCFGTTSHGFESQAIGRLGAIMRRRGAEFPTETELNAGLAAIDGMQPRDEMEAMLALQMVATHETAMGMLTRAKQAENMPTLQECGSLAVKLMRTYAAQIEALARLRRGGEQKVVVQHVHVNEGGQAVVGNIERTGGTKK